MFSRCPLRISGPALDSLDYNEFESEGPTISIRKWDAQEPLLLRALRILTAAYWKKLRQEQVVLPVVAYL